MPRFPHRIVIRRLPLLIAVALLAACSSRPSHVEILAAIRADAPGQAWPLETAAYRELGTALFGPGQHVVVTPLSDLSATEASVFDQSVESDSLVGANPMQIKERAAKIRADYDRAIVPLAERHVDRPRTEIISAVVASASRFEDDPADADKVLVILSTGFEQSGVLNMGDASLSLRAETPAILASLRHRDLVPNLAGVRVCMAGITAGANGWADTNAALAIKTFWDDYFRATGARLIDFSPTISATCLAAVRRVDLFAGSHT